MTMSLLRTGRLRLIVSLVLLGVGLVAFAPIQLGGQAAYVIISGNSMEPGFHLGDLVIIRAAASYQVGDIVTYRHPTIGFVIHRIVARESNHFILKGDNNGWLDSFQPTSAQIVGRLWLHLPSVGKVVRQLRSPRNMALLSSLVGVFIMISAQGNKGTRQRARRDGSASRDLALLGEAGQSLVALLALVACVSLALTGFAFTRPLQRLGSDDVTYQQIGSFSYSATVPSGVYDTATVTTGEPVFRRLATSIELNFAYRLQAEQAENVHGHASLSAVLSDVNGWKRTIELAPDAPFDGPTVKLDGVLDLNRLQSIIDRVEQEAGLHREQYQLAVVPSVVVEATVDGQMLRDTFVPPLKFHMDSFQIQLANDDPSIRGDQLQPVQPIMIKREHTQPNTLAIFALELPISIARGIALFGLGGSLAGLLVLAFLMRRALGAGEAARIRARYAAQIITLADREPAAGQRLVRVAAFDDLARLAERNGRMILHSRQGAADDYYVQDDALLYHYAIGEQDDAAGAPA